MKIGFCDYFTYTFGINKADAIECGIMLPRIVKYDEKIDEYLKYVGILLYDVHNHQCHLVLEEGS